MNRKVFVCTTVRHIFTSILFISHKAYKNSIIIVACDHQNISLDTFYFQALYTSNTLKNTKIILLSEKEILSEYASTNVLIGLNRIGMGYIPRNVRLSLAGLELSKNTIANYFEKIGYDFSNDEIFLFHDRTHLAKFFLRYNEINLIEDGFANYYTHKISSVFKSIHRIFKGYSPLSYVNGEFRNIRKVYLTEVDKAPSSIKNKVVDVNFVYNPSNELIEDMTSFFKLKKINDYSCVFLTQGLDVAGLCTNKQKMELYKGIFQYFHSKGLKVLVKTHPSEIEGDYAEIIKEFTGLDMFLGKAPLESLSLINSDIRVISLFSSSKVIRGGRLVPINNLINDIKLFRRFELNVITKKANEGLLEIDF